MDFQAVSPVWLDHLMVDVHLCLFIVKVTTNLTYWAHECDLLTSFCLMVCTFLECTSGITCTLWHTFISNTSMDLLEPAHSTKSALKQSRKHLHTATASLHSLVSFFSYYLHSDHHGRIQEWKPFTAENAVIWCPWSNFRLLTSL